MVPRGLCATNTLAQFIGQFVNHKPVNFHDLNTAQAQATQDAKTLRAKGLSHFSIRFTKIRLQRVHFTYRLNPVSFFLHVR